MAMLADAANVREGLLNVLSGGVTQLGREAYPAPMLTTLALSMELSVEEWPAEGLKLDVRITSDDGVHELVNVSGAMGIEEAQITAIGQSIYAPVVVDLTNAVVPAPGAYSIHVAFGEIEPFVIRFTAHLPA